MVALCIARVPHSIWFNPALNKIASVPRHREIKEGRCEPSANNWKFRGHNADDEVRQEIASPVAVQFLDVRLQSAPGDSSVDAVRGGTRARLLSDRGRRRSLRRHLWKRRTRRRAGARGTL